MKFLITLTCACGDRWRLTVPPKYRTQEFFDYALAEWKKIHGEHLYKVVMKLLICFSLFLSLSAYAQLDCRDFGTKGDGITDDTAALQQSLNSLTNNSRFTSLHIPRGAYRVTQTLYVPTSRSTGIGFPDPSDSGPIRIFGDGISATRILPLLSSNSIAVDLGGQSNCPFSTTVEGFSIIAAAPFSSYRGIAAGSPNSKSNFFGGTGLILRDLQVTGFSVGLSLSNIWGSHVSHCFFNNNIRAVDCMDAHYSYFERCEINGFRNGAETDVGIGYYSPGGGVQSMIVGCAIRFCKQAILTMDGVVTVIDGQFDDCGSYATALYNETTWGCLKMIGCGFTESFQNGGVWTATNGFPAAINCDCQTAHCVSLDNCMFEWASPRPLFSEVPTARGCTAFVPPSASMTLSFPTPKFYCVWKGIEQLPVKPIP